MSAVTAAAVSTESAAGLYGVFTVNDVQVALPLSELREVIPCPPSFEPLLASAPGLAGAVNLRHQVIPVVDLRLVLGMDNASLMDVIVIVAHEGHAFGLLATDVHGVVRVEPDELFEHAVGGSSLPLFSLSFERADTVVCVLDSAAVQALPGMPVVKDTGSGHNGPGRSGAIEAPDRTVMLLRCEPFGLCIDVTYVHSVIPELLVKSSPLDGPSVRGVVRLGDHEVPVIDPLAFLGLGSLPVGGAERGVALNFERGLIVLSVSDVVRIVPAPPEDVLPLPESGLPASGYLEGILSDSGTDPYLLLDGAAIRASEELDTLAALGLPVGGSESTKLFQPQEKPEEEEETGDGTVLKVVRKYLTYNAGTDVATPLAYITEILSYPEDLIPITAGGAVQGVFIHRGTAIPLVCLPTLLGRGEPPEREGARVLLVESSKGYVGFAVPALRAIEESVWEQPPQGELQMHAVLGTSPLVEVGDGEQSRMLPNVDLRAVGMAY
ncbi:chemotaxis protein CheW [Virgisporangium ochraceum]|uniref:chemotaxis protein CheW n=1 Tax=Virgisporangium ochraceum TaxID=65505 RepID=UPI00194236AE|nr:chemotaxis protein CheW [Virgisporangium ochraceum]